MYAVTRRDSKIHIAKHFTLDMIKVSCIDRFKEGQKVKLIFANDRSDHEKVVKAKIIKFYPLHVRVQLSKYEFIGLPYIDFAKAARRGLINS